MPNLDANNAAIGNSPDQIDGWTTMCETQQDFVGNFGKVFAELVTQHSYEMMVFVYCSICLLYVTI